MLFGWVYNGQCYKKSEVTLVKITSGKHKIKISLINSFYKPKPATMTGKVPIPPLTISKMSTVYSYLKQGIQFESIPPPELLEGQVFLIFLTLSLA